MNVGSRQKTQYTKWCDGIRNPDSSTGYFCRCRRSNVRRIDQKSDGLDDFDQDGDGFIPNEYVGVGTLGLVETGQLPGGDCDDEDALRHPDTMGFVTVSSMGVMQPCLK